MSSMKIKAYIRVNKNGSLSIFKFKPNTDEDEVLIIVNFSIPKAFFERPSLEVNVNLPELEKLVNTIDATLLDWVGSKDGSFS